VGVKLLPFPNVLLLSATRQQFLACLVDRVLFSGISPGQRVSASRSSKTDGTTTQGLLSPFFCSTDTYLRG
jgi:hypothetical protein